MAFSSNQINQTNKFMDEFCPYLSQYESDGKNMYDFLSNQACDYSSKNPHLLNLALFGNPTCNADPSVCALVDDVAAAVCDSTRDRTYHEYVHDSCRERLKPCTGNLCMKTTDTPCELLRKACDPEFADANMLNPAHTNFPESNLCRNVDKHCATLQRQPNLASMAGSYNLPNLRR